MFVREKISPEDREWLDKLIGEDVKRWQYGCHVIPYRWYVDRENDVCFFDLSMAGGRGEDYLLEGNYFVVVINKKDVAFFTAWIHAPFRECRHEKNTVSEVIMPMQMYNELFCQTLENALECYKENEYSFKEMDISKVMENFKNCLLKNQE